MPVSPSVRAGSGFCAVLALSVLRVSAAAATPVTALLLSEELSLDEQALYLTLQGHVNGNDSFASPAGGRMWLYEPVFWSNPASTYIFPTYLTATKGLSFTNATSFCDAFTRLGAQPQGLILYNATHLDASRWLALTSAGLLSALPVTAAILANTSAYSCIAALPVLVDYRSVNFTSNVEAVAWGLTHLAPLCNDSRAYSGGHSFCDDVECIDNGGDPAIDIGLDLAIAQHMFVFNLSPDAAKYPAHAAQFKAVAAALVASAGVGNVPSIFGWAEPEDDFTGTASSVGAAVVCDAAPNLSLWARLPVAGPVTLPYPTPHAALNTSAYYLTFQTNEGDTPKILAALMQGAWLDPRRGSVPIAWGINPLMLEVAPALLEYYTSTASAPPAWPLQHQGLIRVCDGPHATKYRQARVGVQLRQVQEDGVRRGDECRLPRTAIVFSSFVSQMSTLHIPAAPRRGAAA